MFKFSDNDMFCKKCFLHDTFWSGGNSWGIDYCPNCKQREGIIFYTTVLWKDMSLLEKSKAVKLHEKWWNKKWRLK